MHEPNLQNIPRDFDVVVDGNEGKSCTPISMRLAFIPSSGKNSLLHLIVSKIKDLA